MSTMKATRQQRKTSISKVRAVSHTLLTLLLLYVTIANEIPELHNHTPQVQCGDELDLHHHCERNGSAETEITSSSEIDECPFLHWNTISQSISVHRQSILFTEEFTNSLLVKKNQNHTQQEITLYDLRAPPKLS